MRISSWIHVNMALMSLLLCSVLIKYTPFCLDTKRKIVLPCSLFLVKAIHWLVDGCGDDYINSHCKSRIIKLTETK